tara:strand:+ start:1461 stop:2009 length:549 start_codon:yes stop_codon:yes gene_type:complete
MKVEDHDLNKEKILTKIAETNHKSQVHSELVSTEDGIKYVPITDRESFISNSDWGMKSHSWFKFALSERDQETFIELVLRKFKKSYFQIRQDWFNQYDPGTGSEHPFHVHTGGHINCAGIYYVELNDKSLVTILRESNSQLEVQPEVREGEILFFPSNVWHRSPPNNTRTRKTVVPFNIALK